MLSVIIHWGQVGALKELEIFGMERMMGQVECGMCYPVITECGETRGCGGGENDGAGGIVECVTPSSRVATREKNGVQCNKLDKWIPRSSIKI